MGKLPGIVAGVLALWPWQGWGQVEVRGGLRLGATTSSLITEEAFFDRDGKPYGIALDDVKLGLQGGVFLQLRWERFVLQPEVLFNTSRRDYRLRDLTRPAIVEQLLRETYHSVDFPVLAAYRWGPLRLQAGPLGQAHVGGTSQLAEVDGYSQDYPDLELGYQAGIGLDVFRVLLDLKYQGGFVDVGRHLSFDGSTVRLGRLPASTVLSVGLAFN